MRYTTIIDISEMDDVYRNRNVVAVYLHLVLKSGYHDDDRDKIRISIRRLASDLDMTISAIRHALRVLQNKGLLTDINGTWIVTKWVSDKAVSKRTNESEARARQERALAKKREREEIIAAMSVDEIREWQTVILTHKPSTRHGIKVSSDYDAWHRYLDSAIEWKVSHNHCV